MLINKKIIFFILLFTISIPNLSFAQIKITEIMYDLEGSDSGREWIEVYNTGSISFDLETIKIEIKNDTSRHTVVYKSGESLLKPGDYGIIADNTGNFLVDVPNYASSLFDSNFSLGNTNGETISIYEISTGKILDTVVYTSSDGAAGDGNSLHISESKINASIPTPGTGNNIEKPRSKSSPRRIGRLDIITEPNIGFLVGVPIDFSFIQFDSDNKKIQFISSTINFGDGQDVKAYEKTSHIYKAAGTYTVVVFTEYRNKNVKKIKEIKIVNPDINLKYEDGFITLINNHSFDINISNFILQSTEEIFEFPDNSILSGNNQITLNRIFKKSNQILLQHENFILAEYVFIKKTKNIEKIEKETKENKKTEDEKNKSLKIKEEQQQKTNNEVIVEEELKNSLLYWLFILIVLIIISLIPILVKNYFKEK